MINRYIRTLELLSELEGPEVAVAVSKLVAHLKSRGRLALLPQMARTLRRIMVEREKLAPCVEVAREKDAPTALEDAARAGVHAKQAVVNPALVTGWRARSGSTLIDRSGKRALVAIYQKVTA